MAIKYNARITIANSFNLHLYHFPHKLTLKINLRDQFKSYNKQYLLQTILKFHPQVITINMDKMDYCSRALNATNVGNLLLLRY